MSLRDAPESQPHNSTTSMIIKGYDPVTIQVVIRYNRMSVFTNKEVMTLYVCQRRLHVSRLTTAVPLPRGLPLARSVVN